MARAVPGRRRRGQVRRQRHGRRRPQGGLRAGHRVPAVRRPAPGRRPRRRPADRRDARAGRPDQRVPRRPAGHHPRGRWTSSGWSSPARSGASSSACSTSTARCAVGLSGEDAGLFGARKRSVVVDGELVDLGLVGDVETVNPSAVMDILDAGRIPVVSTVAPDLDDESPGPQRQRRHRRRRRSRSPSARTSWSSSPTSRASTAAGPTPTRCSRSCRCPTPRSS